MTRCKLAMPTEPSTLYPLIAQPITPAAFAPYGQVIQATEDGKPYDSDEAQLVLNRGIPRFYIMRLHQRGQSFNRITRHQNCTQCLGSLNGQSWLIAVAPPSIEPQALESAIAAFQIPGNCFIKLHLGTWHAGPFFDDETVDFYNLELSDTNLVDHDTWTLQHAYQLEVAANRPTENS